MCCVHHGLGGGKGWEHYNRHLLKASLRGRSALNKELSRVREITAEIVEPLPFCDRGEHDPPASLFGVDFLAKSKTAKNAQKPLV